MKHTNEHWKVVTFTPKLHAITTVGKRKYIIALDVPRGFAEYVTFLHNREYEEAINAMRTRRRIVRSLIAGRKSRKSGADEGMYAYWTPLPPPDTTKLRETIERFIREQRGAK